jgi:hypothetical protein
MGMDIYFTAETERGSLVIGSARKDYALFEFVAGMTLSQAAARYAGFYSVEIPAESIEAWYAGAYGAEGDYEGWKAIEPIAEHLPNIRRASQLGFPVRLKADW